jgi:hypothetical protein
MVLHTTKKTEDKVEGRLFLDVIVGQSSTVFELLFGEDETLLVRHNDNYHGIFKKNKHALTLLRLRFLP